MCNVFTHHNIRNLNVSYAVWLLSVEVNILLQMIVTMRSVAAWVINAFVGNSGISAGLFDFIKTWITWLVYTETLTFTRKLPNVDGVNKSDTLLLCSSQKHRNI